MRIFALFSTYFYCGALALAVFLAPNAFAYRGSISFSEGEKFNHERNVRQIGEVAAQCLQQDLSRHKQFLSKYGISAFYGENGKFATRTRRDYWSGSETKVSTTNEEKREMLRDLDISENLVQQFIPSRSCPSQKECPLKMEATSCIGITLKCLNRGFNHMGEGEVWKRIRGFVRANNVQGDALQFALQQLGWKLAYWNPATRLAHQWDEAEQNRYPSNPKGIWGRHAMTLNSVKNSRRYYTNRMDDVRSMVNFGTTTPDFIKQVPFFVGIAHLGYHVFAGSFGQIIEAHSTRALTDFYAVETSPFNPLVKGGGPRGGPYKSGVVAVPPGYIQ